MCKDVLFIIYFLRYTFFDSGCEWLAVMSATIDQSCTES